MVQPKWNWLVVDSGEAPAGRVAMRTIRARLDAVWAETIRAVNDPTSAECVHRLRVATRRTLAAIDAFRDLLPPKRRAWFEKRLRQLRRAAGDARDLDVLTGRLAPDAVKPGHREPSPATRVRARLVAMLSRQRTLSRQPIHALYERLVEAEWSRRVDDLLERIQTGRRHPSFRSYARRRFRPIVSRFFAKADRPLRGDDDVHALRIEGKKLRYVLEIFAPVFPPPVRNRCQNALERLQETLGEFTDHAAAADRFRRLAREDSMSSDRRTLIRLGRRESAMARDARKAFEKWWNHTRRRALRRTFARSLRRQCA